MQTIFRLVNHHRLRRIDNAIRHDDISAYRQTVHEDPIVGAGHLLFIYDPFLAVLSTFGNITFWTSVKVPAPPALRVNNLSACESFIDVIRSLQTPA